MALVGSSWVDASCLRPGAATRIYDSALHRIVSSGSDALFNRWKWLSANTGTIDMSDFFSSLRISKDVHISDAEAILLYASQKGEMPDGPMHYTLRDGSDGILMIDTLFT